MKVIMRSNGRKYTIRDNRNRVFYPNEWMNFYDNLRYTQKFNFNVLINTGARTNEAKHITLEDIDFNNERLTLRVTKKRAKEKPTPRIIPISTQFAKYLKKNLAYSVFLTSPALNIAMRLALIKAKIKDYYMFAPHNVRKTLETWLLALGVEPMKIILHFGHNAQTAIKHYISPDAFSFKEKQQIREIIGNLYQK